MSDYTIRGHPFMTSTQKESGGEEGGGRGGSVDVSIFGRMRMFKRGREVGV